jgi:hypothetical protein
LQPVPVVPATAQPASLSNGVPGIVDPATVVGGGLVAGAGQAAEGAGEIYAPAAADSPYGSPGRPTPAPAEAAAGVVPRDPNRQYSGPVLPARAGFEWNPATDGEPSRQPTDRGFARPEAAPADDFDLDELNEVFRPDPARQQ